MITPAGKECRYYYADHHRGRNVQECRLIAKNRNNREPWVPALCSGCPVPDILQANQCPDMHLEGEVVRKWLFLKEVKVTAYCTRTMSEVKEPRVGCSQCHIPHIQINEGEL